MKIQFNTKCFLIAVFIFAIEVLIATVWTDIFFVRAYLGDVIVVMLMYYFILAFVKTEKTKLIITIFIFACIIEFTQYFHFAEILGFKKNKIMMIVLGNSFSWIDILCYAVGCLVIFGVEKVWDKNFIKPS